MVIKSERIQAIEALSKQLFSEECISVEKLLSLNDALFKVLLRVQELEASKAKWRTRAEKAEKQLKRLTSITKQ